MSTSSWTFWAIQSASLGKTQKRQPFGARCRMNTAHEAVLPDSLEKRVALERLVKIPCDFLATLLPASMPMVLGTMEHICISLFCFDSGTSDSRIESAG